MNKDKKTKLKPLSDSIDFEPEYVELMLEEDALFKQALKQIKMFCGKQGIGMNSEIINEVLIKKIARNMSNLKIKQENRLTLSSVQRSLLDIKLNPKKKVIALDLD
ncbi:MAG: hypothetical protein RPS47_13895 [Colwellia sp.]